MKLAIYEDFFFSNKARIKYLRIPEFCACHKNTFTTVFHNTIIRPQA